MTSEQRLALLTAKAKKYSRFYAQSKSSAVKVLTEEGLYTKTGALSPNYGGKITKPTATAKRA
jgi:hypothetical protein